MSRMCKCIDVLKRDIREQIANSYTFSKSGEKLKISKIDFAESELIQFKEDDYDSFSERVVEIEIAEIVPTIVIKTKYEIGKKVITEKIPLSLSYCPFCGKNYPQNEVRSN